MIIIEILPVDEGDPRVWIIIIIVLNYPDAFLDYYGPIPRVRQRPVLAITGSGIQSTRSNRKQKIDAINDHGFHNGNKKKENAKKNSFEVDFFERERLKLISAMPFSFGCNK